MTQASQQQIEAFFAVAKTLSFSKASEELHLTQSAISHRIKNLEDTLSVSLFIRRPSGVQVTPAGEVLFRYCKVRQGLDEELVRDISAEVSGDLGGHVRVAAYSSVLRSVIMPALSKLMESHDKVVFEFICYNQEKLPDLLHHSKAEFIVMDHRLEEPKVRKDLLGYERMVVIEHKDLESRQDIYIDNSPEDRVTEQFFIAQGDLQKYRRIFFSDCYGIIEGVQRKLGRAVMPAHLLGNLHDVRIVSEFQPYTVGVYLHYYEQAYYSRLHQSVVEELSKNCHDLLS
ncbi:MAG: LysR family transcriptional regulator [Deltaproteobacteria bacterium]|nr:LysR family transcriptional regulator [Deltaproteobacteria bacterium]